VPQLHRPTQLHSAPAHPPCSLFHSSASADLTQTSPPELENSSITHPGAFLPSPTHQSTMDAALTAQMQLIQNRKKQLRPNPISAHAPRLPVPTAHKNMVNIQYIYHISSYQGPPSRVRTEKSARQQSKVSQSSICAKTSLFLPKRPLRPPRPLLLSHTPRTPLKKQHIHCETFGTARTE